MAEGKKRIMVATDGSNAANQAVRYAASLAKRRGVELVILSVISHKKVGYWGFIDTHFQKELKQASLRAIAAAEQIAQEIGAVTSSVAKEGEHYPHVLIAETLLEIHDIWVLVLGDKGLDMEARHAVGSTTQGVLHELSKRGIPVPVLVVPFVANVEMTI